MELPGRAAAVVRRVALELPCVASRRLFGGEAFFTAGHMFGFLADDRIVVRLPAAERSELVARDVAAPFVSERLADQGGWVELESEGLDPIELHRALSAAHEMARSAGRPRRRRRAVA